MIPVTASITNIQLMNHVTIHPHLIFPIAKKKITLDDDKQDATFKNYLWLPK